MNINQISDKMLPDNNLRIILISVLVGFTLLSCSDSSTGVNSNDQKATINGSVADQASKTNQLAEKSNHAGNLVSAARITSNGSLEVIEGTETEANASGDFSVEVDAGSANNIVIVAERAEGEASAFVATEVENGNSYTVKPLNSESTAETSVYSEVVAHGNTDLIHKADIALLVTGEAASQINSSSSSSAEFATALTNNAEARSDFFSEFSSSDLETAFQAITEAHVQYNQSLDANEGSGNGAYNTFINSTLQAYADAGLKTSDIAKLMHLQAEIIQSSMESSSTEIKNSARVSASIMASIALDSAVRAEAESSSASDATVDAIVDAGTRLKSSVETSSGASSEISGAFSTYHEEVRAAFENDGSIESTVIVAVDTQINATGGAKFDFENSLSGLLQLSSITSVYTDFSSQVETSVETQSELLGDVDVDVATEIVVLMNIFA